MVRNIAKDFQTWSKGEKFLFLFGLSFWLFAVSGILLFGDLQASADEQKGINHQINLEDGITFTDNLQVDQTIEGVKYHIQLEDGIATRDNLR